ncbi:hypothetical protein ABFS83_14G195200 [Erythranthe nasuta]
MVTQEESHRSALQPQETGPAVGFAAQAQTPSPITQSGRPFCTFCQRQGHIFERCWTRFGITPTSSRGGGHGRGRVQSSRNQQPSPVFAAAAQYGNSVPTFESSVLTTTMLGLSAEQLHRLLALIEPTSTVDKISGKIIGKIQSNVCWLIDNRASHHMTGNLSLLHNVHDIPPSPVELPDGDSTTAVKDGIISLRPGFVLRHVLYVPNLAVNLVSVSKLIRDANFFVIFTDRLCIL